MSQRFRKRNSKNIWCAALPQLRARAYRRRREPLSVFSVDMHLLVAYNEKNYEKGNMLYFGMSAFVV